MSDKILKALQFKKGEEFYLHRDSICNRLRDGNIYKKYYLIGIEIQVDSISDGFADGIWIRFQFQKITK